MRKKERTFVIGIAVVILLAIMLGFIIYNISKGGANMKFDEEIIDVLNELDCDFIATSLNEEFYSSYSVVESSDLELIQAWNVDGKVIELWIGKGNGYLALIRGEDKVYCAQYINDFSVPDLDTMDTIPEDAYIQQGEYYGDGVYIGERSAFFWDGQCIRLIYYYPGFEKPSVIGRGEKACILYWTNQAYLDFVKR